MSNRYRITISLKEYSSVIEFVIAVRLYILPPIIMRQLKRGERN